MAKAMTWHLKQEHYLNKNTIDDNYLKMNLARDCI